MVDQALQHHHEAPCTLAHRAVGVLLQEQEELLSYLGQHCGHVVSGDGISVVKVHHSIFEIADLEFCARAQVGGELLDEGQKDGLVEWTGLLAEHLLGVDGLAHVQDQIQVCCG